MLIAKADGSTENFNPSKLVSSLRRAGANEGIAEDITRDIGREIWSGISTQEIYSRAFARLRDHRRGVAARYSLKRAVLDFGPSGFPFEAYIAELFRVEGFPAKIDQIIQGACVDHEVDVVVETPKEKTYIEAKFHNTLGFRTDLKVTLYVQARMEDIRKAFGSGLGLIVTNTKFTSKAVSYAKCQQLGLLGWDYPHGKSLHERIDAVGLYPVTALTSLSNREKRALLQDKVVLCNALTGRTEALEQIGISGSKASTILEEVGALCVPQKEIL